MKKRYIKPTAALLKRYARPVNLLELKDEQEELKQSVEPAADNKDQPPNANLRR